MSRRPVRETARPRTGGTIWRGQAHAFKQAGFTAVWIPPVLKGASGGYSSGYDPFDDYDLGSKNGAGTIPTHFGTREQLERSCAMMRANGLDILVDVVDNHRAGDDGSYNFKYNDAYGVYGKGRFQKGPGDFHWNSANIPQDPNVPDPAADYSFQFGRDLAPVNGYGRYVFNGLIDAGDWMTKALDCQGYRLDDVKGISTDWLNPFLNSKSMANKYAVGEYYDANRDTLNYWVQTSMQNRCSVFDFSLREQIKAMCSGGGYYDMAQLDHAGLAGINPGGAVTFVENHDTDGSSPVTQNKMLGYALILTTEGYPCVYYKDWSTDAGCYGLQTPINNLVWIHEKLAAGGTQQRYKDSDVYAFERTGGNHLLVGLNDNGASARTVTVATGFYPNTHLHDYTGHRPDVYCDGGGQRANHHSGGRERRRLCLLRPGRADRDVCRPELRHDAGVRRRSRHRHQARRQHRLGADLPPVGCRGQTYHGSLVLGRHIVDFLHFHLAGTGRHPAGEGRV